MAWQVLAPGDVGVVRMRIVGQVDGAQLTESFRSAVGACLESGCYRVLCDVRDLVAGHTVVDLYATVTDMAEAIEGRDFREAVVVGDEPHVVDLARFFETTCLNRGIQARVFDDEGEALTWLTA